MRVCVAAAERCRCRDDQRRLHQWRTVTLTKSSDRAIRLDGLVDNVDKISHTHVVLDDRSVDTGDRPRLVSR